MNGTYTLTGCHNNVIIMMMMMVIVRIILFCSLGFREIPGRARKRNRKLMKSKTLVLRQSRSNEDGFQQKMAGKTATVIRKVITLILAVCVDLSLFYASGFAVANSVFGHLARLWVCAVLRFSALSAVTLLSLGHLTPLLIRFITAHSLLPAVLETGTKALYHEETQCGLLPDTRCWLMGAGASLAAALFWEITIPDSDDAEAGKEKKQKARELFMRVLYLYKPDYLLLLAGLVFLTLAVLCEYNK